MKIGKHKANKLICSSNGRFIGVTVTKKDGSLRKMNCRYTGKSSPLGYALVIENKSFKNVNLQTLSELRMNKQVYTVK